MKEKKFRKQISEMIQDKFQELDVTLAKLLISFRQLYNDVANNESRIKKIEAAVQDTRTDQALTKAHLAQTILKNHKLKRRLRHANRNANSIHWRTMEFRHELDNLKTQLSALKHANPDSINNTDENQAKDDEFIAKGNAMSGI